MSYKNEIKRLESALKGKDSYIESMTRFLQDKDNEINALTETAKFYKSLAEKRERSNHYAIRAIENLLNLNNSEQDIRNETLIFLQTSSDK